MNILYFCTLWGSDQIPFEVFCQRVSEAGYDGIELWFDFNNTKERDNKLQLLEKYGLKFIAQHYETSCPDADLYIEEFTSRLEWLISLKPLLINSHTGRDWFSVNDNQKILNAAQQIAATYDVNIVHETHRGKFSFCAATTALYLKEIPNLRLAADFSHWCNVSESLLENQDESVALAIERADHIHSRVGHPQGPQVSDPRAPEWADAVNAHLAWWDAIVVEKKSKGKDLTITPEFGPVPYMPTQPYTRQPVASQWEINEYMMNLLRKRYS